MSTRLSKIGLFLLSFVGALAVLFGLLYYIASQPLADRDHGDVETYLVVETQDGAQHPFNVELALTFEEVSRGLMNRRDLPRDGGMLFIFGENKERQFWMKNTFIPLDIIFINQNGVIHHIYQNATPLDESKIDSNGPIWAVLEVNGGVSAELGIKKGDIIYHSEFGNALEQ